MLKMTETDGFTQLLIQRNPRFVSQGANKDE